MRKPFALGLAMLLALMGIGWVWWQNHLSAQRTLERSATVVEAVERVMKLSTVEMSVSDWRVRKDSKNLLGFIPFACEKTVAVFFRGKVAAGFDLGPTGGSGIEVNTDASTRKVRVQLPAARLLYTDVPAPELLVTDGSLCNPVDAQDYARLHEEARKAVQATAISQGILQKAEAQARDILTEVVRPLGLELELHIAAPALVSASPY